MQRLTDLLKVSNSMVRISRSASRSSKTRSRQEQLPSRLSRASSVCCSSTGLCNSMRWWHEAASHSRNCSRTKTSHIKVRLRLKSSWTWTSSSECQWSRKSCIESSSSSTRARKDESTCKKSKTFLTLPGKSSPKTITLMDGWKKKRTCRVTTCWSRSK